MTRTASKYDEDEHEEHLSSYPEGRKISHLTGRSGARSFLGIDGNFFAHGGENNNVYVYCQLLLERKKSRQLTGILLLGTEKALNLLANLSIRHLDIILGLTIVGHEGQKAIVGDIKLNGKFSMDLPVGLGVESHLQAEVHDVKRWERPCCEWMDKVLPTSSQ